MTAKPIPSTGLHLYRRLLRYVWPYKLGFAVAILGMLLLALSSAAFTADIKPLIDYGFAAKSTDSSTIRLLTIGILGIFALRAVGNLISEYSGG